MAGGRETRYSEIANLAFPANAPLTLRISNTLEQTTQALRRQSYPGGRSNERGGTIVTDAQGELSIQNIGGLKSTKGSFTPNLTVTDPKKFRIIGTFHTHPYDRTEHSYNGVSFSGADFAVMILDHLTISILRSGPRLFALINTAQAPATIDYDKIDNDQNAAIKQMIKQGRTFQQASRILAEQIAPTYGMAYYQGLNGVLTRVSPR